MNNLSKTVYFYLSILISLIYSRDVISKNQSFPVHSNLHTNSAISLENKYRQLNRAETNSIIWQEDFENDADGWVKGSGWDLTENKSHTPSHSMLSPDDNTTLANDENGDYYLLFSPKISLPEIGLNEWIYFTFWLYADIPDDDSEEDSILDDFYQLDLQVPAENPAWDISDFESYSGKSYWCGIEADGGYNDGWLQFLDTPSIQVPADGGSLEAANEMGY